MVRILDPFWEYVEDINDGCKKCKFCEHIYTPGTSVSRVKYHLSGLRRAGVKICEMVPEDVREAARAAVDGPPEKKHKTTASSRNNEADDATIPASLPGRNSEAENGMTALVWLQTHIGEIELDDEVTYPGDHTVAAAENAHITEEVGPGEMEMHSQLPITLQPTDPVCPEAMHTHSQPPTTLQPMDLDCQEVERLCPQICYPSVVDDVLTNEVNVTREPEQTVAGDGPCEGLQLATSDEARGDVFPTPKLVGGVFEESKNLIWSWLMDNEVSLIGIYGMGGVGKTTLLKHIHNQLLDKPDKYRHVYWITVSQDFSIYKLQNLIAKRIGLDLSNEDEEMHRAAKLSKALAGRQKYVLILDDLWNHFEPEEMGIASKMDGCKLILTTRSLDVCRRMGCEGNVIKVEPLSEEEAWNLFKMELGNYDIILEPLVKAVASECDGLPLGIRTMARSMRGVYYDREWRNALEELKESRARPRDMEPEVFRILKYSFHHLNDSKLQQCFLYCALFPEDFEMEREELIEFLISERMIESRKSRQAEFDKGHEIINQLENACLLQRIVFQGGDDGVKMHDLVRDMALQQMRDDSHVMVEAGKQLEEIPDEEKWSQDLLRVSLMENAIKEIPSSHSPRCPNLSTLLLSGNAELKFIGDSFFKQFPKLEVLDLSDTAIQKLPDSISDLVTLTALLLKSCSSLTHVPSLANLKALKKLGLAYTALREVPRGLELLSSLEYLDLRSTCIKEFPAGILPKLCRLQVLRLPSVKVGEELACLRKLEILVCGFDNLLAFKNCLKELDHDKKETRLPSVFKFIIGAMEEDPWEDNIYPFKQHEGRGICLHRQKINKRGGDVWVLPKGIEKLVMDTCPDMKSLCDFYPSQHETELKSLLIWSCQSMECLVSFSQMSKSMLGTIEYLSLENLRGLRSLFSKEGAAPIPLLPGNGIFSHLKALEITNCKKLETLFPPGLLRNLQNLEVIEVEGCSNLEKIISEEESNISISDLAIEFNLPKLRIVRLENLPALISIGCGKLICNSLQKLEIRRCERLKRLPFSCCPRALKRIKVVPKTWWESVEWDLKNDYTVRFGGGVLYGLYRPTVFT